MFLHHAAYADIQERLGEVNRTFTSPAVVTDFAEVWGKLLPAIHVVTEGEVLDLQPAAHDLVVHAMALHWANDPLGQLIQCRRALLPDGMFVGVLFGGQTLNELRSSLAVAETSVTNGLSPRVLPMAEIRDLGGLLQRAGFALPVADSITRTATYGTLWALMADIRAMGEANALASRPRKPTRRAVFDKAAEVYAATCQQPDGRLPATFDIICLTGWAPHPDQQTPLRPGSARQRLADALSVAERPLPKDG